MKKHILFLLSVLSTLASMGQGAFEKYIPEGGVGTSKLNLNELSSGNIFSGIAWLSGASLFDPWGNILHTQCYGIDTMLIIQSAKKVSDNEFYFANAYVKNINGEGIRAHPLFGKLDSLGNISFLNYYHLNATTSGNSIGDLEVISNKCVIGWDRDNRLFILKADSNLVHLWSRYFDQEGVFHFVKELPGGDLLAGFDLEIAGACLMRMDASGNILWCKNYFRPGGEMHDAVIETDSSFVVVGYSGNPGRKLFMMQLDGNGEVQWCHGYNSTQYWGISRPRIVRTLDNNYVLLASTGSVLAGGRAWLMKTDMNGDTLWTRRAGVNGVSYDTVDLLATADGGYMFDGQGYPAGIYIFKTDSMGHLPCSEAAPAPLYRTELFPVDSNLTLTSVDGAVTYPAYAQDTTYAAITTIDGCTITSVQDPFRPRTNKPRIHPNPSSGHFTMDFPDPLTVDSFYSVYDAMGRLLFQRPLSKSMETVEIDLSSYGKGMYLIRFSDRDGVCAERVVVE